MSAAPELKATLTLPQTAFPMKANLPQNEPLRLAKWASLRLYDELRKAGRDRPAYILHDGPPYANGPIHLGHALNKGLKDFVVKSKTMAGFDSPYIPGFDCHGLPIEIKVEEQLGRRRLELPAAAILEACREYAQKYVDLQTSQFERIGCFGRWDKPYKTMARDYEARTLEAFYGFLEKGFVYRGLKPVYWCIHDRTTLAEAEIEYEMHTSPSIYVRYRLTSDPAAIDPALAGRQVSTIIWTTTPWTLPASLAVAFHPDFEYVALEAGSAPAVPPIQGAPSFPRSSAERMGNHESGPVYIVAAELAAAVAAACQLGATKELARFKGRVLDRATFQHPFLNRSVLGVLATYVTADTGTGAVHTAPAHGADDFYTGQRYGLDPTCRVDATGHVHVDPAAWNQAAPPAFEGLGRQSHHPGHAGGERRAFSLRRFRTLVSPLLALPQSGHLPRHRAVVHRHGDAGKARRRQRDDIPPVGHRGDRQGGLGSGLGQGAHHQHDRHAARLVHQPAEDLGRAHRRFSLRAVQ
jgi:isoleucyl-tRNA synthetase